MISHRALAIAALRLRVPKRVKLGPDFDASGMSLVPPDSCPSCCAAEIFCPVPTTALSICNKDASGRRLLNYLVGLSEQSRRHGEPERLSTLEVDHKLELGRLLDGQIRGLGAFEDFVDVCRGAPEPISDTRTVGHEAAERHILPGIEDRRQPVLRDEAGDASAAR